MKNIWIRSIVLLLLIASALSLTACDLFAPKPETNIRSAAAALTDRGYTVNTSGALPVDGYEDDVKRSLYATKSGSSDFEDEVWLVEFKDEDAAKDFYKEIKAFLNEEIEELEDELKELKQDFEDEEDYMSSSERKIAKELLKQQEEEVDKIKEIVIGRSGKTVWCGSKDAIEDTK